MITVKFIFVKLNIKHCSQHKYYNGLSRLFTMQFLIIFYSFDCQSHLVTKLYFVENISAFSRKFCLFQFKLLHKYSLSLFQVIFLKFQRKIFYVKFFYKISHQMALANLKNEKYHRMYCNDSSKFIKIYILKKTFYVYATRINFALIIVCNQIILADVLIFFQKL